MTQFKAHLILSNDSFHWNTSNDYDYQECFLFLSFSLRIFLQNLSIIFFFFLSALLTCFFSAKMLIVLLTKQWSNLSPGFLLLRRRIEREKLTLSLYLIFSHCYFLVFFQHVYYILEKMFSLVDQNVSSNHL